MNAEAATEAPLLVPDRAEAERFILALVGSVDAPVTFQTFSDPKPWREKKVDERGRPWPKDEKGKPKDPLARVRHGTLAARWDELVRLNRAGAGIYIMVNQGDGRGRSNENVRNGGALRALFLDDDTGELTLTGVEVVEPSIAVQSRHGLQVYWRLRAGERLEHFTTAQEAFAHRFGCDEAIKDLARVMRLPGFFHQKDRAEPFPIRIVQVKDAIYSIAEVVVGFGLEIREPEKRARGVGESNGHARCETEHERRYIEDLIAKARREIESAEIGTRNPKLTRWAYILGGHVGSGHLARSVAAAELAAAASRAGLEEGEYQDVIDRQIDAGAVAPLDIPEEPETRAQREQPPPPESENPPGPGSMSGNAEPWPTPEPFDRIAVPEFPTALLPDWQRHFVEAVALETETKPDLAAMCVLTATAAACARRFAIEQRPGFHVPANLWTLTMLSSGNRKSAVFDRTVTPLREYEAEQALALAPRIAVERSQHRRLERLLAKAEKAAVDAKEEFARRAAQVDADQVAEELAKHKVTHEPCLFLAEATPERLEEVLMEQGGRAAVLASEPALLRALAGLGNGSRNGGDPNLSSILDAHDGGDVRVGRMRRDNGGGGDRIVRGAVVTIGLAPQPERVFSALRAGPAFFESGFAWRFLFSLPDTLLGHRTHGTPPTPGTVLAEYAARMRELLALPEADVIPVLRLTPEAHEALLAFERQLEPAMLPEGELAAAIPWASKLTSRLARIAGLLHAAENRCDPWLSPIELRVMERAIALADYFIPHARAVLLELGSDPIVKRARRALEWIRRERIATFTKHDLHRAIAKNEAAGAAEAVIDPVVRFLEGRDYIHAGAAAEKRTGRPPSPSYNVNPKVHEAKHGQ